MLTERIKDDSPDERGVTLVEALMQDIRYAFRGLRAKPGFTAAVVLTLGLGIGANAAMFGIVDRLMFRSPAYLHDPGRVHRVYQYLPIDGKEIPDNELPYTRYADFARWTTQFDRVATFGQRTLAIGLAEDARETEVAFVSASYFSFFDAPPAIGRYFTASEDDVPDGAPVVVLSYGFWQTHYGGNAAALGNALQIEGTTFTIIGVAPDGFAGITDGAPPTVFIPVTTFAGVVLGNKHYYTDYTGPALQMLVRRRPDATLAAATADVTSADRRSAAAEAALHKTPPFDIAKPHALAGPIQLERGPMASRDARIVTWISGVSFIVLLIACANVANLMLARALRRRREIALRVVLGVGRIRLLAQLLTESVILGALGGVAGLAIAQGGSRILESIFLPANESLIVATDWRTLGFCALAALSAGLITGLAPFFHSGRENLALSLKAGPREGTRQRSALRSALLVIQGTLAVVLLVGAGLFERSLRNVRAVRLGYDIDPVMFVHDRGRGTPVTELERANLARRLEARALGIPGVESVSRALTIPLRFTWESGRLFVTGIDSVRRLGPFTVQAGSPSFFHTTGTRILRGRGITAEDSRNSPKVMIVSESMARALWPGREALGQCIRLLADTMPCTTVVGIAEDIKEQSLTGATGFHYYLPIEQFRPESANLVVLIRVRGNASNFVEAVRRTLQAEMPGSAYLVVHAMSEVIGPQQQSWLSGATMFVAYSGLALILAAIGLYSVIAFDVAQRTHELGVRIALGARVRDVLRLIVGAGVRFAAVGVIVGLSVALAAGRFVSPLLFGVSARDPWILGAVGAALLGVAVAASAIPAVRATRVDPNVALRAD